MSDPPRSPPPTTFVRLPITEREGAPAPVEVPADFVAIEPPPAPARATRDPALAFGQHRVDPATAHLRRSHSEGIFVLVVALLAFVAMLAGAVLMLVLAW